MDWYVAQVLTGKEDAVCSKINDKGIRATIPKRRMAERKNGIWRHEVKNLFPGYVFFHTDLNDFTYYQIRPIPYIIRLLGDDDGPRPVHPEEMNHLLRMAIDGDPLGLSQVLVEGSSIIVNSGPLVGLEGQIVKLDARRKRAKVNISLMGEPRIVELAVDVIKKSEA